METLSKLRNRHKLELRAFQQESKRRMETVNNVHKDKKREMKAKLADEEDQMRVRHERELAAKIAQGGDGGDSDASNDGAAEAAGGGGGGDGDGDAAAGAVGADAAAAGAAEADASEPHAPALSKAERKRQAKERAEAEREQRIAAEKAATVDENALELAALAAQLAPLELRVHTIASDGDCLYHAVADQCTRLRLPLTVLPTNRTLRALAAKEMRAHQDAYAGFVDDGAVAFDEYVAQRVERAGAWGGQLELRALAKALHADITVHQAHRAPLRVPCADDDDNATATAASAAVPQLHVSYHAKQYALGAHYNSLRVVDLSDDR